MTITDHQMASLLAVAIVYIGLWTDFTVTVQLIYARQNYENELKCRGRMMGGEVVVHNSTFYDETLNDIPSSCLVI